MSMKMSKLTRNIIFSLIVLCISLISYAQDSRIVEDFKPTCKTLSKAILKRTTVKSPLKLKNVMICISSRNCHPRNKIKALCISHNAFIFFIPRFKMSGVSYVGIFTNIFQINSFQDGKIIRYPA